METLTSSMSIGRAMEQLETLLNQDNGDSIIEAIRKFKQNEHIDESIISNFVSH